MNAAATSRLSVLDSTFLRIETGETPMHVGALMVFAIPDTAAPGFVGKVVAGLRAKKPLRRPFNWVLAGGLLAPAARTVDSLDMEYHVRHTALPAPGGERELGELVSHLHSTRLDRSRPLWTCHVIEGLEDGRFAIYVKIHHALTDGVNGIRLAFDQLATTPRGRWAAPWHAAPRVDRTTRKRTKTQPESVAPHRAAASLAYGLLSLAGTPVAHGLLSLCNKNAEAQRVRVPFDAPPSALNAPVTNSRRVATQQLDLDRVHAVAKRARVSLNDVFLAVCGDALRRYLLEHDELPDRSLVAGVPVSLREEGQEGGNAVGFLWAALGTDLDDPTKRLETVHASMTAAKDHLGGIAPSVRPVFTMMTMALPVVVLLSGQGARLRPSMNMTISNVPGPAEVRYLAGARMEACYPVSLLFQGLGLNITCISYAGQLNVGIVGGRDALPSLQKIAVHLSAALDDIESLVTRR